MQTHRPQPRFSQAEAARGGDSQVVRVPGHAWGEAGRTAVSCGVPRLSPPPASPEPGRHAFSLLAAISLSSARQGTPAEATSRPPS